MFLRGVSGGFVSPEELATIFRFFDDLGGAICLNLLHIAVLNNLDANAGLAVLLRFDRSTALGNRHGILVAIQLQLELGIVVLHHGELMLELGLVIVEFEHRFIEAGLEFVHLLRFAGKRSLVRVQLAIRMLKALCRTTSDTNERILLHTRTGAITELAFDAVEVLSQGVHFLDERVDHLGLAVVGLAQRVNLFLEHFDGHR